MRAITYEALHLFLDCRFSVTEANRTALGIVNASLTLLPDNAGISFLWFSVLSRQHLFSGTF